MALYSINPHNNKRLATYKEDNAKAIDNKVEFANIEYLGWKSTTFKQRATLMRRVAVQLIKNKEDFATLMALEMGKPLAKGRAEVEKCAWLCNYFADEAENILADVMVKTEYNKSYITYNPLGVILAVMPWNYPFWQVFRCTIPAIMAGNTMVVKHAPNITGCAKAIQKLFIDAGAPTGLVTFVYGNYNEALQLTGHKKIAGVTITGSNRAGRSIATKAATQLKKCVLELGGSDAYIVLKDADLNLAAEECASSRLKNGGQSCISAKRFIIDKKVIKKFTDLFIEKIDNYTIGNPLNEAFDLGPLARIDLKKNLLAQVFESEKAGAHIVYGNHVDELEGAYFPATVLTHVTPGMPAFDEEVFGPVAAIITAENEQHAIQLANQSIYGLGGAVFTKNIKKGEAIASKLIEAGTVFVNKQVNSHPYLPFGGIKESGYGREMGLMGIKEFTNIKSVVVSGL